MSGNLIRIEGIDNGNGFDFGQTAEIYAKYRDIYPEGFYKTLLGYNIGAEGQNVLDLGTGSGAVPRSMVKYGAKWTGADISAEQAEQAKALTANGGLAVDYIVCPADDIPFEDDSFDAVTACQCFWYFPKDTAIPEIKRVLKPGGRLAVIYMIHLPGESEIVRKSEEIVLKYNPRWSGANYQRAALSPPPWLGNDFAVACLREYVEDVTFTREGWLGRMRTCRGIGASLPPDAVERFDREHRAALREIAGETFDIPHQFIYEIYDVLKGGTP